jgi:hypothetical protein
LRGHLIAKIKAACPVALPEWIEAALPLASNDELRRHLAIAEYMRDTATKDWPEPSPRFQPAEAELMRRVLMSRTGAELPPHRYVLASDECAGFYRGPAWVPFNLWQQVAYDGRGTLESECARRLIETPGSEALWAAIAKRYPRPDRISTNLAFVCADALERWRLTPRDKPADFKEGRQKLAHRAEQLAKELERFYLPRDADEHEWPGLLDFTQLMTEDERGRFDLAVRIVAFGVVNRARKDAGVRALDWEEYDGISKEARALGYQNEERHRHDYLQSAARWDANAFYDLLLPDHTRPDLPYGGVPTLPDMLRRIAAKFRDDADVPPLTRPNLANAERNFFTRFLCKYFWKSTGDVSPAIVRDIVSMFYPQGISADDVSQIVAVVRRDYPLPDDPENSGVN